MRSATKTAPEDKRALRKSGRNKKRQKGQLGSLQIRKISTPRPNLDLLEGGQESGNKMCKYISRYEIKDDAI